MSIYEVIEKRDTDAEKDVAALLRSWIDEAAFYSKFPYRIIFNEKLIYLKRLRGMSIDTEDADTARLHTRLTEALSGMTAMELPFFAFAIRSNGSENAVYFGDLTRKATSVSTAIQGALEDAIWESADPLDIYSFLMDTTCGAMINGGIVTGMPALPTEAEKFHNPILTVINGMRGRPFTLMYLFQNRSRGDLLGELARNNADQSRQDALMNVQYLAEETERYTQSATVFNVKRYHEMLQGMEQHYRDGLNCGFWEVYGTFFACDKASARQLSALLQAGLSGSGTGPEPIRVTMIPKMLEAYLLGTNHGRQQIAWPCFRDQNSRLLMLNTSLSSRQLATLIMLPDQEVPGFFINSRVPFDVTARKAPEGTALSLGRVQSSVYGSHELDEYLMEVADLDRHALVVGATGGGKSNTTRSMLLKLWSKGYPFMVIESAKSEYWQLARVESIGSSLCVLQLGDDKSPFRLNPFECIKDFSLQTHVDSLLATFNAAFEMYSPMPYILERSVYRVYRRYGWDVATGQYTSQTDLDGRSLEPTWPTLSDLYLEIPVVVQETAYDREVKNNVQGALQTRVRSLMIGGKGIMMDTRRSTSLERLLKLPLVLELESLGNDAIKAFCIGLLMNRLYEYRRASSDGVERRFSHLLVIEEAHRLLKRVSTQAEGNTQAASVAFFCNMLSEIRSYGQGILIADQSPTKLAQDALRNTNLKIVHRIVDADDRQAVAGAMHMNEAQTEALTMLQRGRAAVYSEGDHRPRIVRMELVNYSNSISRNKVLEASRAFVTRFAESASSVSLKERYGYILYSESFRLADTFTPKNLLKARLILEDNGPNEEILFRMVQQTFKDIKSIDIDHPNVESAKRMMCVAGILLERVGIREDIWQVAMERFYQLIRNNLR